MDENNKNNSPNRWTDGESNDQHKNNSPKDGESNGRHLPKSWTVQK